MKVFVLLFTTLCCASGSEIWMMEISELNLEIACRRRAQKKKTNVSTQKGSLIRMRMKTVINNFDLNERAQCVMEMMIVLLFVFCCFINKLQQFPQLETIHFSSRPAPLYDGCGV